MAKPTPDPTFGGDFDAAAFRSAIRNVMFMALPQATEDRATFRWTTKNTYAVEDPANNPYSWTETPATTVSHPDVQVPVVVQFQTRPAESKETDLGEFDATRATVTILDVDYALVQGADQLVLGGNTYTIDFVAPPTGLFDVTVYELYAVALDES